MRRASPPHIDAAGLGVDWELVTPPGETRFWVVDVWAGGRVAAQKLLVTQTCPFC